jgi:hypothetical protein
MWTTLLVGALAASAAVPRAARAQSAESQSTVAQALFDEAKRLAAAGKYDEACPKFRESYAADPATGTLLNLAVCYEKQGKTALAWSTFKTAETAARRAGQSERAKFAADHLAALEGRLARLTVMLSPAARVPGVQVTLDDVVLGEAAWGVAMPVDPGTRRLRADAPGKRPFEELVEIPATPGARKTVEIPALVDAAPGETPASAGAQRGERPAPTAGTPPGKADREAPSPQAPAPASGSEHSSARRTVGWVAIGAGAVGVGVGSFFGLRAISRWDDRNRACAGGCTPEAKTAGDDAKSAATVADVGIAAGLAVAAVGVFLVWPRGAPSAEPAAKEATLRLSPALGRSQGGVSLSGTW